MLQQDVQRILPMKLTIGVRHIIIWLFVLVLLVNALGIFGRTVEELLGYEGTSRVVRLFHVGLEGNITTWFSSILLLSSAALLAVIALGKRRLGQPYVGHWLGLALIFLYLSIDEAARVHELTIDPLREAFNPSGVLYYAWVIVAIPLVLLFALLYLRFLLALPRTTQLLFVAAGAMYVFAALGMDMIGGLVLTSDLESSAIIADALVILEEFSENAAVALFISALLLYMKQDWELHEITLDLV
jgi:hypothetical protein